MKKKCLQGTNLPLRCGLIQYSQRFAFRQLIIQRLIRCRFVRNQGCGLAWLAMNFCIFMRETTLLLSKPSNTRADSTSQRRRTELRSVKCKRWGLKARPARSKHFCLTYNRDVICCRIGQVEGWVASVPSISCCCCYYFPKLQPFIKLNPSVPRSVFDRRGFAVRSSQRFGNRYSNNWYIR